MSVVDEQLRKDFADEFKYDFDREKAIIPMLVRSDGAANAKTVQWDRIDPSGQGKLKTRDGKIKATKVPGGATTADLVAHYEKHEIDDFDLFRTNPNTRAAYVKNAIKAVNKSRDQLIINQLDSAAVTLEVGSSGSPVAASSLSTYLTALQKLYNNDVQNDGEIYALVSPTTHLQMLRIEDFKDADRVDVKPMQEGPRTQTVRDWMGVKWVQHSGLTNVGAANTKNYIFHRYAVGHQDTGDPTTHVYWDEDDDSHKCWAKAYHAAAICLPRGIVRLWTDDTAAFA